MPAGAGGYDAGLERTAGPGRRVRKTGQSWGGLPDRAPVGRAAERLREAGFGTRFGLALRGGGHGAGEFGVGGASDSPLDAGVAVAR